jgi:hypothetical protein
MTLRCGSLAAEVRSVFWHVIPSLTWPREVLKSRLLKAGLLLKPYITDCWDAVARPVVIYIVVSQPEALIFYLALRNYIHEAGSCSTSQEIPHLVLVLGSYTIVFTRARRRMLS